MTDPTDKEATVIKFRRALEEYKRITGGLPKMIYISNNTINGKDDGIYPSDESVSWSIDKRLNFGEFYFVPSLKEIHNKSFKNKLDSL